jgi:hypothetical protein
VAVLAAARTIPFDPRDWLTLGWLAFTDRKPQEGGQLERIVVSEFVSPNGVAIKIHTSDVA